MNIDSNELIDRIPPHNLEAEQSALGAMLWEKEAIDEVAGILESSDFYKEAHRLIFDAIVTLHSKSEPVDLIMVTELLKQRSALDIVGGAAYISSLANSTPTAANAQYYARIVKDKSTYRTLINAGNQIIKMGFDSLTGMDETLDRSMQLIYEIVQQGNVKDVGNMGDILSDVYKQIEAQYVNKGKLSGLSTGFFGLDEKLFGLQKSELIIIAARPSMGKTALAMNIAAHVGLTKKSVLIFSLEMPQESLVQRMLSSQARVDNSKMRSGFLEDSDWGKISMAVGRLNEASIYIDDSPGMTIMDIRSRARKVKADKDLDLIVVDYLQLIKGKGENRQQEIAEITRGLKSLARELNVPVLSLAQLNRQVEQTNSKKPMLSHLKESGEIEQTADVVLLIHRHDYYKQNADKEEDQYNEKPKIPGLAEIIIAKNRNGETGLVELLWQNKYLTFDNISHRTEK